MRMLLPLLAALTLAAPLAEADVLKVPVSEQGNPQIARPQLGMSMDAVKRQFGEPLEEKPAVGNPPITRWIYAKFIVYFENSTVIHSVLKK